MALNTWWMADAGQRYWMEITHRADIGGNLQAPKLPGGQWSYDLVSQVQADDRVLHWSGTERALVGWSTVLGSATTVPKYTWQPRGTSGRALPGPRTTEGWVAPLAGLQRFETPPTRAHLQTMLDQLMDVNKALADEHGDPTYFPFYRYGGTQLRTQQAYFVKFPEQLFELIPGIQSARIDSVAYDVDGEVSEDFQPVNTRAPSGHTTRVQDPKVRAAIERRALDVALEYYRRIGGTDARELGKPYDLAVVVDGVERHCEVKGSSMLIDCVELTINEVNHGKDCCHADLIVVDGIHVAWDMAAEDVKATGGAIRVWTDWSPDESGLAARRFSYTLPSASS